MKISCLVLNSNLINLDAQNKIVDYLSKKLYEIGENFSLISYFDNNYDKLNSFFKDDSIITFVIGSNSSIYNHNIKENLSRIFNDKLENSNASFKSLNKYCLNNNIVFSVEEEMEVLLPSKSIPLCGDNYYNNGFMYKFNDKYVIFLPSILQFCMENYLSYILPLLNDLIGIKQEYQVLKCFGILEKDLKHLISEVYHSNEIDIQIINNNLDNTIYIRYSDSVPLNKIQDIISDICFKIKKFLYSTDDFSIYETAFQLLKLQNKNISICETITNGEIYKNMSQNSEYDFVDNVVLANSYEKLLKRLPIDNNIINQYGKYSVNTVYEFSNLLLQKSSSDIVVFVLGDLSEDVCYIAVGDIDGIHVYKNKIAIKDENLIENLSKTTVFYLIKKLKQNDLLFN